MRAFIDLVLPPTCCGCGREGVLLCHACGRALCRRMGEPAAAPLGLPVGLPVGILQLEWCASFSGPVRAAIHALKYGGQRRSAEPLAAALAERWRQAGAGGDVLTWVPVHPARRRERGFDQAEDLCRLMGARLRLPVAAFLERRQRTAAQHALGRGQRAGNVADAFGVPPASRAAVRGRWVVLVDDVVTTGATLAGCARALMMADAMAVSAVAVARER